MADLENYHTIVLGYEGIDLIDPSENNNFEESMADLVDHIKKNSKYELKYEKLDNGLVRDINRVSNDYL